MAGERVVALGISSNIGGLAVFVFSQSAKPPAGALSKSSAQPCARPCWLICLLDRTVGRMEVGNSLMFNTAERAAGVQVVCGPVTASQTSVRHLHHPVACRHPGHSPETGRAAWLPERRHMARSRLCIPWT